MRISDGIAYVDDDGFETPVQVRECVVIGNSHVFGNGSQPIPSKEADKPAKKTQPAPSKPTRDEHNDFTSLPIVETAGGNVLNIELRFYADPYAVGPYASGFIEVSVKLS